MLIQSGAVIKQYPGSITITNAGGFPFGVDMNNIQAVDSVRRSKLMSEVLQKIAIKQKGASS